MAKKWKVTGQIELADLRGELQDIQDNKAGTVVSIVVGPGREYTIVWTKEE